MKKFLSVFFSLLCVATLGLVGCSKDKPECPLDNLSNPTNRLVAYFSLTSHTGELADEIADELDADIFRIVPATAYPTDYNQVKVIAEQEKAENKHIDLLPKPLSLTKYSYLFIGYPIWFNDVPMAVKSFIEDNKEQIESQNMIIIPFCTSGESQIEQSVRTLRLVLDSNIFLTGLQIKDSDVTKSKTEKRVESWLTGLGI